MTDKADRSTVIPDFSNVFEEIAPDSVNVLNHFTKTCADDEWWTWQEALAWAASRNYRSIAELRTWAQLWPLAEPDFLNGGQYQIARTMCGAAVDQLESALLLAIEQGRIATRGRKTATGEYQPLEPIQWRGRAISALSGAVRLITDGMQDEVWFHDIAVNRTGLLLEFPEQNTRAPSHQEVVEWCRRYIDTGMGNGMNKAWETFRKDPEHKGLSRDDVFRPAWNEAKTKIQ